MSKINYLKLAKEAAKIADGKKCSAVLLLSMKKFTVIAEYFVIATAESSPQRNAVINAVEKHFNESGGPAVLHRDGRSSESWSALDYGGLIIHIMSPEARSFFCLEKIWDGARQLE